MTSDAAQPELRARVENGVAQANVPTLLMVLTQLTGELRWLEAPFLPTRTQGLSDHDTGGLTPELQTEVRRAAEHAISRWFDGAPPAIALPSPELMARMLSVCMGEPIPADYGPLLVADLANSAYPQPLHTDRMGGEISRIDGALIIGAGVSGLTAAIALREHDIPYALLEKNGSVGGTWLKNVYPGVGVDTPNHLYSSAYFPYDWKHYFAKGNEIQNYLEAIADELDLRRSIRFGTEALTAEYDEAGAFWRVTVRTVDGRIEELESKYVITAVGGFARPVPPAIPGLDRFTGPTLHTADWPDDISLAGKKVAVIGTGASAVQLVPALAAQGIDVTVFQRTAQWIAPFEKFNQVVPDDVRFLIESVPLYRAWYRLRLLWTFSDRVHAGLQKDPTWPHPERSVSSINDGARRAFLRYIEQSLAGRPDLLAQAVPTYPPFGKRILLDNGWYDALVKPNVRLVTEPIAELDETGALAGGEHIEFDVLALATGFDVVRFLAPMEVVGRGGAVLRDVWDDDDPRAYLGMTVPGFPNLFTLYGPNTQPAGGSFFYIIECQVHYLVDLLAKARAAGADGIEPKQRVFDDYIERVDAAHEAMIFTHPGMSTYYRNRRGRVVVVNPFPVLDVWRTTREASLDDYDYQVALEPVGLSDTEPVR